MKSQLSLLIATASVFLSSCRENEIAVLPNVELSPSEISEIEERLTEWQTIFLAGGEGPSSLAKLIHPGDAERVRKNWMAYVDTLNPLSQEEIEEYFLEDEEYVNLPAPDFVALVFFEFFGIGYFEEESMETLAIKSVNIDVASAWRDSDESVIVRAIQTVDATAPLEPEVLLFSMAKEDDTWYVRVDESLTNELIRLVAEFGLDDDTGEEDSEPDPVTIHLGFGQGRSEDSDISEIESSSTDQLAAAAESQSTVSLEAVVRSISDHSAEEGGWIWELESDGPKLTLHTTEEGRLKLAESYGGDLNAVFRGSRIRVRGKVELAGDDFRIQLSELGQITLLERGGD